LRAVLVGGLGFLGAALAERLISDGWEVVVAARRSSAVRRPRLAGYLEGRGARLSLFEAEIDPKGLEALGGDVYYHLAGSIGGMSRMWSAHVDLARVVVEAADGLGSRVVYVSAVTAPGRVAGAAAGSRVVEEERHLDPALVTPETPFEATKAEGERIIASHRGAWSIVRPGLLVGRWGYHTEWRLVHALSRIGLAPDLECAPLSPVSGVSAILEAAGEGRYDGVWLNAVACTCNLSEATLEACRLIRGRPCRAIGVTGILKALGSIAPQDSPLKEAAVIAARCYRYESRHPQPPWPSPGDAAREWVEWLKWWGSTSL